MGANPSSSHNPESRGDGIAPEIETLSSAIVQKIDGNISASIQRSDTVKSEKEVSNKCYS